MTAADQSLDELAKYFQIQPPPPYYTAEQRLEYLYRWAASAGDVIDAMPEPEDIETREAFDSVAELKSRLLGVAPDALSVARLGGSMLPGGKQLGIGARVLRNAVITTFTVATYGIDAHRPSNVQPAIVQGLFTAQQATEDYYARLGLLQAIVKLANSGALDTLFAEKEKTAGLGAWQTVAVAAVVVVVALAALAWAVVMIYKVVVFNRLATKLCFDVEGKPIPENVASCKSLIDNFRKDIAKDSEAGADIAKSLFKYLVIGGAVYVGVLFLPQIVERFQTARRVARQRA